MSKVKNIVVGAHRRIKDPKWNFKDTSTEGDVYQNYLSMYQASRASLRHFLAGDWEEVCFTEDVDHVNQSARLGWQRVYNMWHQEPCNILIVGPDVSMVRPTRIFDQFAEFRMFNWTDPKSFTDPNPWNISHKDYFNGDLVYIPHTTSRSVWEIFEQMVSNYRDSEWGDDQIITNQMFWSQNIPWEEAHRPDIYYMAHWLPWASQRDMDEWNCFKMRYAHMIHWSGSRNSQQRVQLMNAVNNNLGIPNYNGILK